jgi:hypothetical protein
LQLSAFKTGGKKQDIYHRVFLAWETVNKENFYLFCSYIAFQILNHDFKWSPNQLLAMIREIDKYIPEEGTTEPQAQATELTNLNVTSIE